MVFLHPAKQSDGFSVGKQALKRLTYFGPGDLVKVGDEERCKSIFGRARSIEAKVESNISKFQCIGLRRPNELDQSRM